MLSFLKKKGACDPSPTVANVKFFKKKIKLNGAIFVANLNKYIIKYLKYRNI
jgi:hypothetical protein